MLSQRKGKGRILLADDEAAFRMAASRFLQEEGYDCDVAADGPAALEMLRSGAYDTLISDIHMPGNHELEFVAQVPKVAPGLPVILLTAHPSVETASRSFRLPVVAYLIKPPNLEELKTTVREAVANHRIVESIAANRARVQTWAREVEQLEALVHQSKAEATDTSVEAYVNLTFQNLLSGLLDLKQITESLAMRQGTEKVSREELSIALKKTVEVLERTKHSFKSKDLGDLRKSIETLLETGHQ